MTVAREIVVAACQTAPRIGEVDANRRQILDAVQAAADEGADLVVLPELATSGYVFADADEAHGCAEPTDGPTVHALREACARLGVTVVVGIPEVDGTTGRLHNSAVAVDRTGLLAVYRKAHLWGREPEFFTPGDRAAPVVDLDWGRLGLLVCYDLEFPEWVRRTALDGADIVAVPTNWPDEGRPEGERPVEVVTAVSGASVNRMFVVACDRAGAERGTRWVSGSVVAGPDGYPLALSDLTDREQRLVARCDLTLARDKSIGTLNDRFRDRRTDLYETSEGDPIQR